MSNRDNFFRFGRLSRSTHLHRQAKRWSGYKCRQRASAPRDDRGQSRGRLNASGPTLTGLKMSQIARSLIHYQITAFIPTRRRTQDFTMQKDRRLG